MLDRPNRTLLCATSVLLVLAVPAAAVKRVAFVTGVAGGGRLGDWPDAGDATGLAAGDAICQARAAAAGIANASAFRAWLSTSTTDAYCHVRGKTGKKADNCGGGLFVPTAPWYRLSGTPFTGSLAGLAGSEHLVYQPVYYDEDMSPVVGDNPEYWTATWIFGEVTTTGTTCNDWTSSASEVKGLSGHALAADMSWTSHLGYRPCSDPLRLLCVESGVSEAPVFSWSPASIAFLTAEEGTGQLSTWDSANGATGLAAADEVCRAEAAAAHLPAPESFVAFLSGGGVSAASRLVSPGPFRRVDGLRVATTRTELLTSGNQVPIHQFASGAYTYQPARAWTGSDAAGLPQVADCADWASADGGAQGAIGTPGQGYGELWAEYGSFPCNLAVRLVCFSNVVTLFWDGFEGGGLGRWSAAAP